MLPDQEVPFKQLCHGFAKLDVLCYLRMQGKFIKADARNNFRESLLTIVTEVVDEDSFRFLPLDKFSTIKLE